MNFQELHFSSPRWKAPLLCSDSCRNPTCSRRPGLCSIVFCQDPEEAAQLNSPLPSLQNPWFTGGKGLFARGLFLGLKWIQLWAAPAATAPLSPRTGTPDAAAGKTLSRQHQKPNQGFPRVKSLCSHPGIHGHRCLVTGSVMLSPSKVFSVQGGDFCHLNSCPSEEPRSGVWHWYSSTNQGCWDKLKARAAKDNRQAFSKQNGLFPASSTRNC